LCAISQAIETNQPVSISSEFTQPQLMEWTLEAAQ